MFYLNKHNVFALVADKYHFREPGLCAPPVFAACTSSDEPFSTLKRPALWMAPSASLEISWEETEGDMFRIRDTWQGMAGGRQSRVAHNHSRTLHCGWKAEPQKHHPHVIWALLLSSPHPYFDTVTSLTVKLIFLALFSPHSIYQPPSILSQLSVSYLSLADSPLSAEVKYCTGRKMIMLEGRAKEIRFRAGKGPMWSAHKPKEQLHDV